MNTKTGTDDSVRVLIHALDRAGDVLDKVHVDDLVHAWHEIEGDPPTPAQWQVAELAVHTWDLATAIGLPVDGLDPEVAETALGFMRTNRRAELRGQAFSPERLAPPDAGPYAQLAAFADRATG